MLKRLLVLTAAVLLAVPAVAMAAFQTGDYELTLNGSGSSDNDFDNNTFDVQFSLGYFFTEQLEGILRQQLGFVGRDNADDDWNASTAIGADYNFSLANFSPFLGATLGYVYGDNVDETWFAAPEGGVKYFVNSTTFVQALVQYQWFFDEGDDIEDNFDDGRFVYGLGLGFRW
ncbi:MAG: hypothetical protein WDA20_11900 [Desulfuromonadales bacterium]